MKLGFHHLPQANYNIKEMFKTLKMVPYSKTLNMHAAIPATLILTSLGFHVTHHKTIIMVAPASAAQVLSTNPLQNLLLPAWNEAQNNLL